MTDPLFLQAEVSRSHKHTLPQGFSPDHVGNDAFKILPEDAFRILAVLKPFNLVKDPDRMQSFYFRNNLPYLKVLWRGSRVLRKPGMEQKKKNN
jgi:hypothetical protein